MSGGESTVVRRFTDVNYLSGGQTQDTIPASRLGNSIVHLVRARHRNAFASETEFEYDPASGEVAVDGERVIVRSTLSEHLRHAGGEMHSVRRLVNRRVPARPAISPAIDGPMVLPFENDEGALHVHTTDVELSDRDMGRALGRRPAR